MPQAEKVDFGAVRWGSVEWTNLVTLYLRACDSRSPQPILGDIAAADAVDRIDYDWTRIHRVVRPGLNQWLVTLRAAQLDEWSTEFLHRHPDATVLHLGCGMDTRAFRLPPPPGVRWFDVDQPDVIALRRRLYDEHAGYRMIGSSVTDSAWLEEIPAAEPTAIIAEGLFMYLHEPQVRTLLQRLTDRFRGGQILFDTLSPIAPRLSKIFTRGIVTWGIGDARELERWNPRLRFLDEASAVAGCERIPSTPLRRLYRLLGATPVGRYDVLNRFAFGTDR